MKNHWLKNRGPVVESLEVPEDLLALLNAGEISLFEARQIILTRRALKLLDDMLKLRKEA